MWLGAVEDKGAFQANERCRICNDVIGVQLKTKGPFRRTSDAEEALDAARVANGLPTAPETREKG